MIASTSAGIGQPIDGAHDRSASASAGIVGEPIKQRWSVGGDQQPLDRLTPIEVLRGVSSLLAEFVVAHEHEHDARHDRSPNKRARASTDPEQARPTMRPAASPIDFFEPTATFDDLSLSLTYRPPARRTSLTVLSSPAAAAAAPSFPPDAALRNRVVNTTPIDEPTQHHPHRRKLDAGLSISIDSSRGRHDSLLLNDQNTTDIDAFLDEFHQ